MLLDFITRTEPRSLSLQNIRLHQGALSAVINYCTSEEAGVKELFLDTLYEPKGLVHFAGCRGHLASLQDGCEGLQRDPGTIKHPFSFSISKPIFIGSPGTAEYKRRQCLEYV